MKPSYYSTLVGICLKNEHMLPDRRRYELRQVTNKHALFTDMKGTKWLMEFSKPYCTFLPVEETTLHALSSETQIFNGRIEFGPVDDVIEKIIFRAFELWLKHQITIGLPAEMDAITEDFDLYESKDTELNHLKTLWFYMESLEKHFGDRRVEEKVFDLLGKIYTAVPVEM